MKQSGTGVTGEGDAFRTVVGRTADGPVMADLTALPVPYSFGEPGRGKVPPSGALPGDGEVVSP